MTGARDDDNNPANVILLLKTSQQKGESLVPLWSTTLVGWNAIYDDFPSVSSPNENHMAEIKFRPEAQRLWAPQLSTCIHPHLRFSIERPTRCYHSVPFEWNGRGRSYESSLLSHHIPITNHYFSFGPLQEYRLGGGLSDISCFLHMQTIF